MKKAELKKELTEANKRIESLEANNEILKYEIGQFMENAEIMRKAFEEEKEKTKGIVKHIDYQIYYK